MKSSAFLILLLMMATAVTPIPTSEPLDDFVYTKTDYEGQTFTILHDGEYLLLPEEQNGELINDALYRRNVRIEEMYNIFLDEMVTDDPVRRMKNATLAADSCFDVILHDYSKLSPYALQGYYLDLNEIPTLQLDKNWWNKDINSQLELAGRQFLASSEFTGGSFYNVSCLFYERAEYGDKLYDLAVGGRLTYDELFKAMKSASIDLSGEGAATSLLLATGYSYVNESDEGMALRGLDDSLQAAVDSITKLFSISGGDSYIKYTTLADVYGAYKERTMADYSLLPLPKVDESVQYITPVTGKFEVLAVPVMNENPTLTGDICSALAYYGWEDFVAGEKEMFNDTRYTATPGNLDIVNLLLATRSIDDAALYGIGGFDDEELYGAFMDGNFASLFERNEIKLQRGIDKYAAMVEEINN